MKDRMNKCFYSKRRVTARYRRYSTGTGALQRVTGVTEPAQARYSTLQHVTITCVLQRDTARYSTLQHVTITCALQCVTARYAQLEY